MTEREQIVAWLREAAKHDDDYLPADPGAALAWAADTIERCAHLKDQTVSIPMLDLNQLGEKPLGEVWEELLKG